MDKNAEIVKMLQYSRHDWLNRLQLIKGNIALNRIDRVEELMDEIVFQTRQEAIVSSLNTPQLAYMLLTYNWQTKHFLLEYEINIDPQSTQINDQLITNWLEEVLDKINYLCDEYYENKLKIIFAEKNKQVQVTLHLTGILKIIEEVPDWDINNEQCSVTMNIETLNKNELRIIAFI